MFNTSIRGSKSLSCESLFYERSHSRLKRKLTPSTTPNTSMSFKNDDYNYLINCNELIKTCKEALLDQEKESPVIQTLKDFVISDGNDSSQKNDEMSIIKTQEFQKKSLAEFWKWLSFTELQLESVCYCAKNKKKNLPTINREDVVNHHKALQQEIENVGRRFINEIKGFAKGSVKETKEERRWHQLWLKSLEFLMILEAGVHCPQHYNLSVDEQLVPSKKLKNNVGTVAGGTGGIRNKRVQTKTTMVGESKSFLNNLNGDCKFEIIQKDIGYSSDADMSDAVDAHPHSDQNNLNRNVRKRQVRRRRSRVPRTRPWSFHSDWTDWDYYQTPLNYGEYNLSSENLFYYENDNTIRNLIEFGENYETWISNEDDDLIRVSTPQISHSSSENEPKLSALTPEVTQNSLALTTDEGDKSNSRSTTTKRSSSSHLALKLLFYASALAILLMTISVTNFSPHIEKIYPHRPPPI